MAVEIPFRRDFAFEYGRLEEVAPGIRRIVARNPGPFTFRGTGTYVIGEGQVAVIDPGPDLPEHIEALLMDLAGEEVTHILVTHTHRDHSPAAAAVKEATGAPTYGFGPHAGGRRGEVSPTRRTGVMKAVESQAQKAHSALLGRHLRLRCRALSRGAA